jgi:predicted dehydrogenase
MKNIQRRDFIKSSILTGAALGLAPTLASFANTLDVPKGKRIGVIGLDTSHSEVFTRMINTGGANMKGFKVVAAYEHGSKDIPSAIEMKPRITAAVQKQGVQLVDSIQELVDQVDYVLLESNDGRPHLEQAMPIFQAGKKAFIDKPIAANYKGAQAIFEASAKYNAPIFSSSALRYDNNVRKVVNGSIGAVQGADVYAPGTLDPNHSDLAWYAIHAVEMLFTVMGPGCKTVQRTHHANNDVIVGTWGDGRIGTVRAIRKGATNIAGTAFGEKGIAPLGPFSGYEPLVEEIINFFDGGEAPVKPSETLEIFAFINAADQSKKKGGKVIKLT